MPKKRKPDRKLAATIRVAANPGLLDTAQLKRIGTLEVVQGAAADVGRQVRCEHPIVIGRDEEVDLCLHDGSISRSHCSVEVDGIGRHVVVDLGSTNGTTVNGVKVVDRTQLNAGDKIFLGASVVRFSLSDSVDIEYHSRIEELVSTDPLTGLYSKRQYDAFFDVLAQRAVADHSALAVLVMDMDGLKQINDSYGHDAGSYSIAEVAKIMEEVLSDFGHLARFGGDEFVGCFPQIDAEGLASLAERFRAKVVEHDFEYNDNRVFPTVSVGIASFPRNSTDPTMLFRFADQALYEAKRAGKNRVICSAKEQPHE